MDKYNKSCFIIMPVTVPEDYLELYHDGVDHFRHVLDWLFIPAIKQAGYDPILPIALGLDLINAEIINNIEKSDLVLCDLSTLNPDVFFEYEIRKALNRPVSVVKDELTKKVSFDISIMNFHEYMSSLNEMEIEEEKSKIVNHLKSSTYRSYGENTLLKYSGLYSKTLPFEVKEDSKPKMDPIAFQLKSIRQKFEDSQKKSKKMTEDEALKKSEALRKKNIALTEILAHIEEEKLKIKQESAKRTDENLQNVLEKLIKYDGKINNVEYSSLVSSLIYLSASFGGSQFLFSKLTFREAAICRLIQIGASDKDIARILHLSKSAVLSHKKDISTKLNITNMNIDLASYLRRFR